MCVECLTIDLIWKMIFAELYDLHKIYWKKVLVLDQFITDMNQEVDFLVVGIPYGNGLNWSFFFFPSLLLVQNESRIFSKSLSPFQHFEFCWTLIKKIVLDSTEPVRRSFGLLSSNSFYEIGTWPFCSAFICFIYYGIHDLGLVAWLICRS